MTTETNAPRFEVKTSEALNFQSGVFAMRQIEENALIFRDTACSVAKSDLPDQLTPLLLDYLFDHPCESAWELFPSQAQLEDIFKTKPEVKPRLNAIGENFHMRSKWGKEKCIRLAAICSINAHRGHSHPFMQRYEFACRLFPLGSRLNHACFPNAVILFDGDSIAVKSITDITPGEQITVRYGSLFSIEPPSVSSPDGFAFDCMCQLCSSKSPDPGWTSVKNYKNLPRVAELRHAFDTLIAENDLNRALCLSDILLPLAKQTLSRGNLELLDLKLKIYSLRYYVS